MRRLKAPPISINKKTTGLALNLPRSIDMRVAKEINSILQHVNLGLIKSVRENWIYGIQDAISDKDLFSIIAASRLRAETLVGIRVNEIVNEWMTRVKRGSDSTVNSSLSALGIDTRSVFGKNRVTRGWYKRLTKAVELIKTIPSQHFEKIEEIVRESITTGDGVGEVSEKLQEQFGVTERRADIIAYDQTRKAFNALNIEQMQEVGIPKWMWLHSRGSAHPRKMHLELHGQIFTWDNPPVIDEKGNRGFPGEAVFCGCSMRPVLI